jgi:signal transduction histidine kinase
MDPAGRVSPAVGTGLGLAIVKGLVEAHAGSGALENADGRGTSFRFTLPLADGPGTSSQDR